jgi:hypothetical protein
MNTLAGLSWADIYQIIILPTAGGVLWVIRKIYLLEGRVKEAEAAASREALALRGELRVMEAKIDGQLNTSSAHHAATQTQLGQLIMKFDKLETWLREKP